MKQLLRLLGPPKTEAKVERTTPAAVDLLWEEGQRRLTAQTDRLSRLDSKATPLLGFGLAAIAFFQTNSERFGDDPARLGTVLAALGLLATLAAIYPRTVSYVPEFRRVLQDGKKTPDAVKTKYLANIRTAIIENDRRFEAKTAWFKTAIGMYLVTTLFTIARLIAVSLGVI